MSDLLEVMLKPFVACVLLTGIHAYLGLHVIQRGVIFVDLALAQLAAFGATLGFVFGAELHSGTSFWISSSFALLGAALFSLTRLRKAAVPQEAIIGIVYAIAAAASILVLSRSAEGGEELKALLVGHLLFLEWGEVLKLSLLYFAIAAVHWGIRKPLIEISCNPDAAFATGRRVWLWDFIFYGTFAFVVTSSVEVAGVLLVFSFLIAPAVCAVLLGHSLRARLVVGWCVSLVTSVFGLLLSFYADLPTGATIVCLFGVSLLVCVALKTGRQTVVS